MKFLIAIQTLAPFTNSMAFSTSSSSPFTLLGPIYPAPQHLTTNFGFLSTCTQLYSAITKVLSSGQTPFGNFTPNVSSVSISMTNIVQESAIFDFEFTGSDLNTTAGGTKKVSTDSVFRIGSISKLFTVYAFLLHGGLQLWERSVTEFVPELRDISRNDGCFSDLDMVRWEEVTLGSLASHMSGIGRDYGCADLSMFPFPWTEHGLPQLEPPDIPLCGGSEIPQEPCTREEYFQGLISRHPVFRPHSTPIYSNTAFRILSYALEKIANKTFEDIMEESVFKPLGLNSTSIRTPDKDSLGVIPQGQSMWFYDIGDESAGGGMYSSASNLAKFGRDILRSAQLSSSVTRRWMKPLAHTSELTLSVGAPWEILWIKSNISRGHTLDLYTKGGSLGLYNSLLILIPDYQISVAILAAGTQESVTHTVAEMMIQTFVPVLHQIAREEARRNLAGVYISDGSDNSTSQLNADGMGLLVEKWISNGSDLLAVAERYSQMTNGGDLKSLRLYPTSLVEQIDGGARVEYRALFETGRSMGEGVRVFNQASAWGMVDQITYGMIGVDDFVFELDAEGNAISIEPRVLRTKLMKSEF